MLCSNLNPLFEVLRGLYMVCANQNGLSEPLQAFYKLCGSQNGLTEHLQASYTLGSRSEATCKECQRLCSTLPEKRSILRDTRPSHLMTFSWQNIISELSCRAPVLHAVLSATVVVKTD